MPNVIKTAKDQINEIILSALGQAVSKGELPPEPIQAFKIEIPADRSNGDFATNVALVSAKAFKSNPRKIADVICSNINTDNTYFNKVEIAGPGFINFFLNQSFYADIIEEIISSKESYGRSDYGNGTKVMVEFVSANPTGPMHIGNARGGAIGDCLASAFDFSGHEVTREFYVNDAGNQIEKFALSLEIRYLQIYNGENSIELPEDSYHGEDIKQRAQEFAEIYGDKYLNCDSQIRRDALVAYALPKNIEGLKEDLLKYRISYNVWFLESTLHKNGDIDAIVKLLTEKGLTYVKDDAIFYKASEFGTGTKDKDGNIVLPKDEVLIRSNGNPTYFAADIAYHYNKFAVRGFDTVINVWGADHHGHVDRLKGAMNAVGLDGSKLDIVLMQLVKLMRDGELVKVSKRTGKSITLSNLLEDVPIDAARFFFNLREPNSHLDFDLDLAVEQSSQNPVYYVQYAHARICSILKALKAEGVSVDNCDLSDLSALIEPEEKELILRLGALPDEIIEAAKAYDPSRITKYVIEVAALFHKFYNAHRVKGSDPYIMNARIALCIAVKTVIHNVLTLLKISAPEIM